MDPLKNQDEQEWTEFMWLRTLSSNEHSDAVIRFKISLTTSVASSSQGLQSSVQAILLFTEVVCEETDCRSSPSLSISGLSGSSTSITVKADRIFLWN